MIETLSFEVDRMSDQPNLPLREISYKHSAKWVPILEHVGGSLLISTYAAGKVACVGVNQEGELHLEFSNFQQAMGLAVGPRHLAVGGPNLIWLLRDAESLAEKMDPVGKHDRGFLARESFVTGNIHVHEMGWGQDDELWIVNTLFSCLCTLHEDFNFVPRWRPPFISDLAPEDRCHLNGLAMDQGVPRFVTALGTSNHARGWRETKSDGGVVIDVASGEVVAGGFCMPHSPQLHEGKLYVLDSGRGRLVVIDPASGQSETVTEYPGYGRGMSLHGQFAWIGMSKARESSVFGGVPICENRSKMRCGVVVVDLITAQCVAYLEFQSGVEELFDVVFLRDTKMPIISGPYPTHDQQAPVWVIPSPNQVDSLGKQVKRSAVSRRL